MRRAATMAVVGALVLAAGPAFGEVGGGRPSGFALEVEVAGATPVLGLGSWSVGPRLFLGGQIGRFAIGGQVGMQVRTVDSEDGGDDTDWAVRIGPQFDFEVWQSGAAGLYISGALPVQIVADEGDPMGTGFGFDFSVGGRLWLGRWLSAGVEAGTNLDVLFYDPDGGNDYVVIGWGLYGALVMRFVAAP